MGYSSHGNGMWVISDLKKFGKGAIIECSTKIFHADRVEIGAGTYIGNQCILKGYPYGGGLKIGDRCWIGENVYLHGAGGINIHDRVGIGPNVTILTSEHDILGNSPLLDNPISFQGVTTKSQAAPPNSLHKEGSGLTEATLCLLPSIISLGTCFVRPT